MNQLFGPAKNSGDSSRDKRLLLLHTPKQLPRVFKVSCRGGWGTSSMTARGFSIMRLSPTSSMVSREHTRSELVVCLVGSCLLLLEKSEDGH